jgi:hypothetical protein
LDIRPRVFLRYFGRESLEFRGGARDEEEIEAFLCELDGIFFSQAVGGPGDYCPGAFLAIFAELGSISISLFNDRELKRRGEANIHWSHSKRTNWPATAHN